MALIIGQHPLYMEKDWKFGRPVSVLGRPYKTSGTDKEDIKSIKDNAETKWLILCVN